MEWTIHQQITIHKLEVGSVANSSILQIGSAGMIKGLSQLFNTGGFVEPAPQLTGPFPPISPLPSAHAAGPDEEPFVPLPLPAAD